MIIKSSNPNLSKSFIFFPLLSSLCLSNLIFDLWSFLITRVDVFLSLKTLYFHSQFHYLAFKGVRIEEKWKVVFYPKQHLVNFTKTIIKTLWLFWETTWMVQQISLVISQNGYTFFTIGKFDIFSKKTFSSSIFLSLFSPIYSSHHFCHTITL
jgi:hypothetical protein